MRCEMPKLCGGDSQPRHFAPHMKHKKRPIKLMIGRSRRQIAPKKGTAYTDIISCPGPLVNSKTRLCHISLAPICTAVWNWCPVPVWAGDVLLSVSQHNNTASDSQRNRRSFQSIQGGTTVQVGYLCSPILALLVLDRPCSVPRFPTHAAALCVLPLRFAQPPSQNTPPLIFPNKVVPEPPLVAELVSHQVCPWRTPPTVRSLL